MTRKTDVRMLSAEHSSSSPPMTIDKGRSWLRFLIAPLRALVSMTFLVACAVVPPGAQEWTGEHIDRRSLEP
jgi:hypothetical protein